MQWLSIDISVWVWTLILMGPPTAGLLAAFVYEVFLKGKPAARIELNGCRIELWVKERKLPRPADAIVAPVPPDLKMTHGVAKMIRLWTANRIQAEADQEGPRNAGDVLIGSGARYRFDNTILAVVTDSAKAASQEAITTAVRNALEAAQLAGASSVIVPDFTEDLLQQPKTLSDEERSSAAAVVAKATLDGIVSAPEGLTEVALWVWHPGSAPAFRAEFARLASPAGEPTAAHAS